MYFYKNVFYSSTAIDLIKNHLLLMKNRPTVMQILLHQWFMIDADLERRLERLERKKKNCQYI